MPRIDRMWPVVLGLACVDGVDGGSLGDPGWDESTHETSDTALPDDPGWRGWSPCLPLQRYRGGDLNEVCAEYLGGRAAPRTDGTVAQVFADKACEELDGVLPRPGAEDPAWIPALPGGRGIRVWCAYPGYAWE
jgi:hypothetical protein